MLSLLWLAVTEFLVPLVVWSVVSVAISLIIAVPTTRWCVTRLRRAGSQRGATSAWLLRACIVVVLFVLPCGIALFHAVPFAVTRGLAQFVERSAPDAATWMTDLASGQVASLLDITHDDTLADTYELQARTEAAIAELEASRETASTFAWIQNIATEKTLRLVHAALGQLAPAGGLVKWRDVTERARSLAKSGSSAMLSDFVTGLHLAAWGQVLSGIGLVVLCHVLAVIVFWYAAQPVPQV